METNSAVQTTAPAKQEVKTVKTFFEQETVKKKFEEILGKRSNAFMTSVLQITSNNEMLKNCEPISIYQSSMMAATLDLPLNNNLGFAYIVPYRNNQSGITSAQFQIGYKGFIQLAQRSGQIKTISVSEIYEGQLIEENPLTGFVFDFTKKTSDVVIGYAAYFKQLNGFEKTLYMSKQQAEKHGKKYSQTFKKGYGLWATDFDAMAKKTVLKTLLANYAPLSVEMQKAILGDQAIINDVETMNTTYVDNAPIEIEVKTQSQHETERIVEMIQAAETPEALENIRPHVNEDTADLFASQYANVSNEGKKGKGGKK